MGRQQSERDGQRLHERRDVAMRVHAFDAERHRVDVERDPRAVLDESRDQDRAFPLVHDALRLAPSDVLLDVGCGAGQLLCQVSASCARAVGVDLVAEMLEVAHLTAARNDLANVELHQADVPPLPFQANCFDVAVTRLALHHMPDAIEVVREMARVTRPGGRVVIVDEVSPVDAGRARRYNDWEQLRDPSHVRFLTVDEHLAGLRGAGLEPEAPAFFARELRLATMFEHTYAEGRDIDNVHRRLRASAAPPTLFGYREVDGAVTYTTIDMVVSAAVPTNALEGR